MNKQNECEHKNAIYVEVLWDFDWILYIDCKDCGKRINKHTQREFTVLKTKEQYWFNYFFLDGELNSYSVYTAEWLTEKDDLSLTENILWGTRWIDWTKPLHFIPIKDISISHIKAILEDNKKWMSVGKDVLIYFNKKLEWIVDYQNDINSELVELVI